MALDIDAEMARWRAIRDRKRAEAGLPDELSGEHIHPVIKQQAMEALGKSQQMGMLRVGNPWVPVAEAIQNAAGGYVIANGGKTKYMAWGGWGCVWTDDVERALRFARRQDAEDFSAECEDAWFILAVADCQKTPTET